MFNRLVLIMNWGFIMKSIIKFVLRLTCLHCGGMQGMGEEVFSIVNIDSNCYCSDVIIKGRSGTHPKQELEFDSLEWQKE